MKYLILLVLISLTFLSCEQKEESMYDSPEKITLTGRVLNAPDTLTRIAFLIHRVGFEQERLETELDSSGRFQTYFTSHIPVGFYVSYQTLISMIDNPGDSIHIVFDGNKEETEDLLNTTVYSGSSAKMNTELAQFQKVFSGKNSERRFARLQKAYALEPEKFIAVLDSTYAVEMHQYDSCVAAFKPGKEAKNWAKTTIISGFSGYMNWYPMAYKMANPGKKLTLPENYYGFLNDKKYLVDTVLYCGSAITNYVTSYQFHFGKVAYEHFKQEFTPEQFKADLFLYDSLSFKMIQDSIDQDLLKQIYVTNEMYRYLQGNDLKSFEHFKSFAETNIKHNFLKQSLFDAYQDLKKVLERPPVK